MLSPMSCSKTNVRMLSVQYERVSFALHHWQCAIVELQVAYVASVVGHLVVRYFVNRRTEIDRDGGGGGGGVGGGWD